MSDDQQPYSEQFHRATVAINNANGQLFQLHTAYHEALRQLQRLPSDNSLARSLTILSWCRRHGTHERLIRQECEEIERWHPGFSVTWIPDVSLFVLCPKDALTVCPRCEGSGEVDHRKPLLGDTWQKAPCPICHPTEEERV